MQVTAHTLREPLVLRDPTGIEPAKKPLQSDPEDPASLIDKPPDISLTPGGFGGIFLIGSITTAAIVVLSQGDGEHVYVYVVVQWPFLLFVTTSLILAAGATFQRISVHTIATIWGYVLVVLAPARSLMVCIATRDDLIVLCSGAARNAAQASLFIIGVTTAAMPRSLAWKGAVMGAVGGAALFNSLIAAIRLEASAGWLCTLIIDRIVTLLFGFLLMHPYHMLHASKRMVCELEEARRATLSSQYRMPTTFNVPTPPFTRPPPPMGLATAINGHRECQRPSNPSAGEATSSAQYAESVSSVSTADSLAGAHSVSIARSIGGSSGGHPPPFIRRGDQSSSSAPGTSLEHADQYTQQRHFTSERRFTPNYIPHEVASTPAEVDYSLSNGSTGILGPDDEAVPVPPPLPPRGPPPASPPPSPPFLPAPAFFPPQLSEPFLPSGVSEAPPGLLAAPVAVPQTLGLEGAFLPLRHPTTKEFMPLGLGTIFLLGSVTAAAAAMLWQSDGKQMPEMSVGHARQGTLLHGIFGTIFLMYLVLAAGATSQRISMHTISTICGCALCGVTLAVGLTFGFATHDDLTVVLQREPAIRNADRVVFFIVGATIAAMPRSLAWKGAVIGGFGGGLLVNCSLAALRLEASAGWLSTVILNRIVPLFFGFLLVDPVHQVPTSETHSVTAPRCTMPASAYIVPPLSGFMRAVYGQYSRMTEVSSDATSSASSCVPRDGSNDRLAALVDGADSQASSGQEGPPIPSHVVLPLSGFIQALYGRRIQFADDASSNLARDGSNDRLALLVDPS